MNVFSALWVLVVLTVASLVCEFISLHYMDEIISEDCCTPQNYPNPVELGVCIAAYKTSELYLGHKDGMARIPLIVAISIQIVTVAAVVISWLVPLLPAFHSYAVSEKLRKWTIHNGIVTIGFFASCLLFVATGVSVAALYYADRPISAKCDMVSGKDHGPLFRATMTFVVLQAIISAGVLVLCPYVYEKIKAYKNDRSLMPVVKYTKTQTSVVNSNFSIDDTEMEERAPDGNEEGEDEVDGLYPHS